MGQLYQLAYGSSYLTYTGENGIQSEKPFVNIVLVNVAGIGLSGDVDGTCTIGDTKYLDMNDTAIIGVDANGAPIFGQYGNQVVAGAIAQFNGAAPVIETTDGVAENHSSAFWDWI